MDVSPNTYMWTVIVCLAITLLVAHRLFAALHIPAVTPEDKRGNAVKAVVILVISTGAIVLWISTVIRLGLLL